MIIRSAFRRLRRRPGRWLAIALAVFLGSGLWNGFFSAGESLLEGSVRHAQRQNFHDLAVWANCGFTDAELEGLLALEEVEAAEGVHTGWGILTLEDGSVCAVALRSVTHKVDVPRLRAGRLPETAEECVLDASVYDRACIGTTVTLTESNAAGGSFTVVGLADLPERPEDRPPQTDGGFAGAYLLLPEEAFLSPGWNEVRIALTGLGTDWSGAYFRRVEDAAEAAETQVKAVIYSRHATMLAQAQTELSLAEAELLAAHGEYDEKFSRQAMEVTVLQEALAEAQAVYDAASVQAAELEAAALALIAEAARIEAEDSAIQRDRAAFEEERAARLQVLEEHEEQLDQAHYEMAVTVYGLELVIYELETALWYADEEAVEDGIRLQMEARMQEILDLEADYELQEADFLAAEAEFETWRQETDDSLDAREETLAQDREDLAASTEALEAEEERHGETFPQIESDYEAIAAETAEAEAALLNDSMDVLNRIAAAQSAVEAAEQEAERLEKPLIRYGKRSENPGYNDLRGDGTALKRLATAAMIPGLVLMLWPCCAAALEDRRREGDAVLALSRMGAGLPGNYTGLSAGFAGAAGGFAGALLGTALGFGVGAGIYGGVYSAPAVLSPSMLWNIPLSALFWGGAAWGFTALCSKRLPLLRPRRSVSVPLAERMPPFFNRMFRSAAGEPGKAVLTGLSVLVCCVLFCFLFAMCGRGQVQEGPYDAVLMLNGACNARDPAAAAPEQVEDITACGRYLADIAKPQGGECGSIFVVPVLPEEFAGSEGAVVSSAAALRLGISAGDLISVTLEDESAFQLQVTHTAELGQSVVLLMEKARFEALTNTQCRENAALIRFAGTADAASLSAALDEAGLPAAVQPLERDLPSRTAVTLLAAGALLWIAGVLAGLSALYVTPGTEARRRLALLRKQGLSAADWAKEPAADLGIPVFAGTVLGTAAGIPLSARIAEQLTCAARTAVPGQGIAAGFAGAFLTIAVCAGGALLGVVLALRQAETEEKHALPGPKRGKEKRSEDQ